MFSSAKGIMREETVLHVLCEVLIHSYITWAAWFTKPNDCH